MSGKLMGTVYDLDLPPTIASVLMSLCDHAWHDGTHVFPGLELTCWKTGLNRRTVQRAQKWLAARQALILVAPATRHSPPEYRIDLDALPRKKPLERRRQGRRKVTPLGRQADAPQRDEGRSSEHVRGGRGAAPIDNRHRNRQKQQAATHDLAYPHLAPFAVAWREVMGGEPNHLALARMHDATHQQAPLEVRVRVWRWYLETVSAQYVSPARFAERFEKLRKECDGSSTKGGRGRGDVGAHDDDRWTAERTRRRQGR